MWTIIDPYYCHYCNNSRYFPFIFCWNFILFFRIQSFFSHKGTISVTGCITWCFKSIVINRLICSYSSLVVLIILSSRKVSEVSGLSTLSLPYWCFKVSPLYSSSSLVFFLSFAFAIKSYQLVCDISSFSDREVSVVSGLLSFS